MSADSHAHQTGQASNPPTPYPMTEEEIATAERQSNCLSLRKVALISGPDDMPWVKKRVGGR